MRFRYIFAMMICTALLSMATGGSASSQSYMSEAASHGFTLKKVVSDTAIATGQNFSYTVYFSIPAGAMAVTITDVLPPALAYQAISVTSACGSPTVSTPTVGSMGGTVSLTWPSVPSGCSGSFVVTVNFPNGVTCNGTTARNRVCLTGEIGAVFADFCTGFVSTRAIAADPWNIGKWILGAGTQAGPCSNVTADSVVTYQLCVWKNVGTTGQLNMENAVVYDTLPPGAMLVPGSSTCGMTQTGNVITWNLGSLSALPMYSTQCCTFDVLYPSASFPTGSQIMNSATLRGTLGSPNAPCGPAVHQSNQTCVEIKQVTSATFSKYTYTNGQPGCAGMYRIWICNNGSLPITSMAITDTIPAGLTGLSVGTVSSGLAASLSGNILTANLSSPLLPTQCRYIEINFTIPAAATPGSTFTNCAWMQITGIPPQQACATFTVNAPAAAPCLWKEVCSKQPSYTPGNIFRYRLRVQNIGGLPISGATITDVLNSNLEYVGNLSFYTGTSWNAPCQTTSNWSGVTFSQTGNTLSFTLPSIPATCQNLFYNYCGMYGAFGVPFYFIEFDVKVSDTTAIGNIPNAFSIAGGNLTSTTTSNTDYVNVVGTSGFFLDKGVAQDTTSWASSTTTVAPSTVNYRLRLTVAPGSVGLRHVTFADLLPRDDGTNDALILGPCTPRGSLFDVNWLSTVSTTPSAAPYNNPLSFATVNSFAPSGSPGSMFTGGCGTLGSWAGGLSAGAKNVGYYFGATPLGAGNTATSVFSVGVPASAGVADSACNTFAANAAVRHLINSSIISDQQIGSLESTPACVFIDKGQSGKDTCFSMQLTSVTSGGMNAVGECTYTVVVSVNNPTFSALTGWFASDQGVVAPGSLTLPSGASSQTLTFTDTAPVDNFVCIRYGILDAQGQRILCDSICFDLPPCDTDNPCDSISIKQASATSTGVDANGDCTYDINLSASNIGSTPFMIWLETDAGSLTPSVLTLPTGSSTQTVSFTDTPPANTTICIRYGYMENGVRILCDSICVDLPPCGETDPCDSLSIKSATVTPTGTGPAGECVYDIDLDFSNGGGAAVPIWLESYAGTVAPNVLTIPAGTSTQTISFTDTPPANSVICIRWGYFVQNQRVLCDSICVDLPPCDGTPCDSLINGMLDTSCCEYDVTILNGVGSPITSISYSISGGTLNSLSTAPCAPVTAPTVGSTSGVLTYSPPCAGSMGLSIQATPTTPGGTISVQLVVHHGQKDSCTLRFEYTCKKDHPPEKCDDVKVKPFHFAGLNLSGRTFKVFNTKVPASPITHIDILPVPVPCFLQGGGLVVDITPTSWSVPYTRIPVSGFISANTQVQFNLGIDYTCGWTGAINLVIHHADGDSCLYSYGPWKALPPVIGTGTVSTTGIDKKVYGNKLRLENKSSTASVKWISVHMESDSSYIIAGSGDHWEGTMLESGYARLDGYDQGLKEALFSFETPVAPSRFSDYFNLVVAHDTTVSGPPVIRWTTYDENGDAIGTDTVRITTPVLSIRGEGAAPAPGDFQLLNFFPNPVQGSATINYVLGRDLPVRLELYDKLGKFLETIDQGYRTSGMQTLRYSSSHLPVGTYYLKLSSESDQVIKPLVIVR